VNATPVVSAVIALPAGWFSTLLVDRVPDRLPWRPLPPVRVTGRYLAIHVAILGLFILTGLRFHAASVGVVAAYLFLAGMLVTVSAIDIMCFRLPDRIVLPSLAASVVIVVLESLRLGAAHQILYALAGGGMFFGILLVLHLISPRGMGFGDVKLAAVMGLYLGWMATGYLEAFVLVVWALLIGAVLGSIIGLILLSVQGVSRRAAIPFGPYLAIGAIVMVLLAQHASPIIVGT
jgi:leader peptidase (prepilin peptidase)/N-methyltransferase